jgi:uncharacterized protein
MAQVLVDTGFLVALLSRDDQHHAWAVAQLKAHPHPWYTCESALSEAFHLLEARGGGVQLVALLERMVLNLGFSLVTEMSTVLTLMNKYSDVPMSLADGCFVRMTETWSNPILLTTDSDFKVYRRLGRKVIPCQMPQAGS